MAGDSGAGTKEISISLGAVATITVLIFVVFLLSVMCVLRHNKRKYDLYVRRQRYKGVTRPRSDLATPTPPATPLVSCSFFLPKQNNVAPNNAPIKSNLVQQLRNAVTKQPAVSAQNVNEFVEEPEVYNLEPVVPRKPKHPTPPDSPVLKLKRKQVVTFASVNDVSGGNDGEMKGPIPPPLPPKSPSGVYVELASPYQVGGREGDSEAGDVLPPPRPPKPFLKDDEVMQKGQSGHQMGEEVSDAFDYEAAHWLASDDSEESSDEEGDGRGGGEKDQGGGSGGSSEGNPGGCLYKRLDSYGPSTDSSGDTGSAGSSDEVHPILHVQSIETNESVV